MIATAGEMPTLAQVGRVCSCSNLSGNRRRPPPRRRSEDKRRHSRLRLKVSAAPMIRLPTSGTVVGLVVETARPASAPAFPTCLASPTYLSRTCRCSSTKTWVGPGPAADPVSMAASPPALVVDWVASTSISTPERLPPRLPNRSLRSFWPAAVAARVAVEVELEVAPSTAVPLPIQQPAEESPRSTTVRFWPALSRHRFRHKRSRCSMRGANPQYQWVANTRARPHWPAASLPWEG
mmetsp:Transcript_27338/g.64022  ORF Transcript_27338/g.64022 Transcript_27338/m.64022 type:complete len:237 (-) Transcript_27338:614-1324(-)